MRHFPMGARTTLGAAFSTLPCRVLVYIRLRRSMDSLTVPEILRVP